MTMRRLIFMSAMVARKALIGIQWLTLLQGRLSPRVFGLVMEWASLHQAELMRHWELARLQAELDRIEPLE